MTLDRPRTTAGRELGIGSREPGLGWAVEGAGELRAQQVQLAHDATFTDLLVDTGRQPVGGAWTPWPGKPLGSRERVHWRARVETEAGWSDWASSVVEAGLDANDWVALPVGVADDPGSTEPGPSWELSTTFSLASPPVRARLYVSALGLVLPRVNGMPTSADVLSPGWSSYGTRVSYDTYDVTGLVSQGVNTLSAMLGDGWYRGGLLWGERRHRCHYGDRLALLAQLEVQCADGSTSVVATSPDSWTARTSGVREADLYDGCVLDLTHEPEEGKVELIDVDLVPRLFVRTGPPVRATQVLPSVGSWGDPAVHDFGQNLAGWVRLRIRASEPTTVTVRHAEVVQDGALVTGPLRTAKATDTYTVLAGEHELEPVFTFHGFRYCEIDTSAEVLEVEAVAVHSDLERTAWFSCSDDDVNRLHENVVWGQRGNFLSVPTDCPQRDERLGWTGDAQVFAATASRLYDSRGFFADWLADLRVEQDHDGRVPVVVPNVQTRDEAGIAGWSDAACVIPWQIAVRTGDPDVLRNSLASMRGWVDWVVGQCEDGLWMTDYQLGDWLDPDGPADQPWMAKADRKLVANAYFVHSAALVADATDQCGEDGSPYRELAARTAQKAWGLWGEHARTTQTGCALSLRFGLVPEAEQAEVAQALADLVVANGGRIATGFLGTPEVLYALSDHGHLDAAYQLLMCHECPSWLYQVDRGATTTWERWDAIRPDGSVHAGQMASSGGGMLSFNHYAYGAVAAWLHDVVVGLQVREVPSPELVVAPRPGGGLTWAEATLQTQRGRARVRWEIDGDELVVQATIPHGYAARFELPDGSAGPLSPGEHRWTIRR